MRESLTKKRVDELTAEGVQGIVWDEDMPGFGMRRHSQGWTYMLKYRVAGRQRWLKIGVHGQPAPPDPSTGAARSWTPDLARVAARKALGQVAGGSDPAADRDASRAIPTFRVAAARFMKEYAAAHLKEGSRENLRIKLDTHALPALGSMRLDRIGRSDVARLHLSLQGTPVAANHVLSTISSVFRFAQEQELVAPGFNPAKGIRWFRTRGRERFLSGDELARLGAALVDLAAKNKAGEKGSVSPFFLQAVRLIVFTGARPGEILSCKWESVDQARAVIRLPESKTGPKTLYLNAPALEVLKGIERISGNPYLIPGHKRGDHYKGDSKAWDVVRKAAGLADVHLHDLRHSFASVAVAGGASLFLVGKLLGHARAATTERYAHLSADPLRAASEAIAGHIAAAIERKPNTEDNVTSLKDAK